MLVEKVGKGVFLEIRVSFMVEYVGGGYRVASWVTKGQLSLVWCGIPIVEEFI